MGVLFFERVWDFGGHGKTRDGVFLLLGLLLFLSVSLCFRILIFFCFFFHHTSLHWAE